MNVPDLARRAAIAEQQKAQAQAADAGLWLKIAMECFVHGRAHTRMLAQEAFQAADDFMAEYKKRREGSAQIPEGWRIVRDGEGWEAIGPKSRGRAESREAVIKWAIGEAEKEHDAP